jgi:YD repeat-containing protein
MGIRKARIKDLNEINQLTAEMHRYLAGLNGAKLDEKELKKEFIKKEELKNVLVADEEGRLVGYLSYSGPHRDEWHGSHLLIEHIVVSSDRKNQGMGRDLFRELLGLAEERKLNLLVSTPLKNKRAIEFYTNLGFKPSSIMLFKEIW